MLRYDVIQYAALRCTALVHGQPPGGARLDVGDVPEAAERTPEPRGELAIRESLLHIGAALLISIEIRYLKKQKSCDYMLERLCFDLN